MQAAIGAFVIFIIGIGIGAANGKTTTKTTTKTIVGPTVTATATKPVPGPTKTVATTTVRNTVQVTTTYTPPVVTAFAGDGEYLIGSDVAPGTYQSPGTADDNCYADTEQQNGDVDAQEVGAGPIILVVTSSAYKVDVRGCAPFHRVG